MSDLDVRVQLSDASRAKAGPLNSDARPAKAGPLNIDEFLYTELRKIAGGLMKRQPRGHTLQPTALVSEAYLKLRSLGEFADHPERGLMSAAANAMRWVLTDHARKRASRSFAEMEASALDHVVVSFQDKAIDLLALNEEIERLERDDPHMARVIVLHFYGGMTMEEVARELDVPLRTLELHWKATKALLLARLTYGGR